MAKSHAGAVLTIGFILALPIILIPSPARADTIWQTATEISHSKITNWPIAWSYVGGEVCDDGDPDSIVQVKKVDDYIYVKDTCRDGRSAMGQVITYDEAGHSVRHRFCRNPHGAGSWSRCNFNWPDDDRRKVLVAGWYNGDTENIGWDHGNSAVFYD